MNILMTFPGFLDDANSGAPGTVLELSRRYRDLGHSVRLLSLDDMPTRLPARARVALFPLFLAIRCHKLARREPLDVIDGVCGDLWAFCVTTRAADRPILVYRSHGSPLIYYQERLKEAALGNLNISWRDHLYYGKIKKIELRASLATADLAIFLSHMEAKHAVEALGVRPSRTFVVPLGISEAFINRPFDRTPMARGERLQIAVIGHHIPRKGTHYAAKALNAVLTDHTEVHVSFLGTGVPDEQVLSEIDSRLHPRIHIVRYFSNVQLPDLLRGHQIKLFATLAEGFGKALLEAMACGLAPVAADAEGVLDIVTDDVNGIVVPRRDVQRTQNALAKLIVDRKLLDRLRRQAHAHAQGFSWQRCAEQRLALYQRARHDRCDPGTSMRVPNQFSRTEEHLGSNSTLDALRVENVL